MKTYIFDYDRGYFVNTAGGVIAVTPTLVYGEQATWRLMLKTATGTVYPLDGLAELTAAVGFGGQTLAATTEGISVDTEAGSVTIPLDCLTEQFYDATAGKPNGIYGFFELSGYDAAQAKTLYLRFNVLMSEIALPDVTSIPGLAERIIAVVSSGGYVTSAQALTSGAEFRTSVGDYRLTYTASGGLMISGGGVELQVSSGAVAALASSYDEEVGSDYLMSFGLTSGVAVISGNGAISARVAADDDNQAHVTITSGGVNIGTSDPTNDIGVSVAPGSVGITGNYGGDGGVAVNIDGRPVAKQLVTSTSDDPSAFIDVLSGGTRLLYTGTLYQVEVSSVAKSTDASYLHFKLDSVTAPTPVVISGVSYLNSATFEGGKEYLVGFFDGMAVVNEVTQ